MSRLRVIHIPFTRGHDNSVDERLLPDGAFSEVLNGRMLAPGSLALRRGWRPLDMTETTSGVDLDVYDLYSYDKSLVALCQDSAGVWRLATYNQAASTRPWKLGRGELSPITDVRRVSTTSDLGGAFTTGSLALTDDGEYGCFIACYSGNEDYDAPIAEYRVFHVDTDDTIVVGTVTLAATTGLKLPKVVSLGLSFGIVYGDGDDLLLLTCDPEDDDPDFALEATLESGVDALQSGLDAVATESAIHVVTTSGSGVTYRQYTLAGVQNGSDKAVDATDGDAAVAIASDGTLVHVVYSVFGVCSLQSFSATSPFTNTDGPTELFGGSSVVNFCVGVADDGSVIVGGTTTTGVLMQRLDEDDHSELDSKTFGSHQLVGGAVDTAIGLARQTDVTVGDGCAFVLAQPDMYWVTLELNQCVLGIQHPVLLTRYQPVAPARARDTTKVLLAFPSVDPDSLLPSALAFDSRPSVYSCDLRALTRRPGATFGPYLYVTGGTMAVWDGESMVESGMLAPTIASATAGTAGSIANGTYTYRPVLTWFDAKRGKHRSIVGAPRDVILTGSNDSVSFSIDVPATQRRAADLDSNPLVKLFRTEAGPGELFYQVAAADADTTTDAVSMSDTLSDSSITDNPRVYTEGEFGAVSGALDITPPRPSTFIAVMRDRLLLGSAGPQFQVSQILLPEEPVAFADPGVSGPVALSYYDTVEGRLTAVATLDDTMVLATADSLYLAFGEGPNLAGIGSFQSPGRLPSDVGVHDWRSVIETSEGLWFQGDDDKLYRLPRGGSAPVFDGAAVQRRFGSANIVGAGRDATDDVVMWTLDDDTAIVHDVSGGGWYADDLPFTPRALMGHHGEVYAVDDSGAVWHHTSRGDGASGATEVALRVTSGPIAAFGLDGHGRLGAVGILGEYQSDAVIQAECSYDDGATWTDLGSHTLSGLTAGDTFSRQWYPARQRGGRFRLRFTMTPDSTTAEGCRLTGYSIYLVKQSSPARLASGARK